MGFWLSPEDSELTNVDIVHTNIYKKITKDW